MLLNKSGNIAMFLALAMLFAANVCMGYSELPKQKVFADALLSDILEHMDKEDFEPFKLYFDVDSEMPKVDLVSRSSKNSIPDDYEFRNMFGDGPSSNPSLRDQEFLQHSSLWGHQYVDGGMGEVPPNRFHSIKTDASLPAYCNPPNPCPYGYDESLGCLTNFENTAIFSREFQAAQECTCDNEHMFDCAGQDASASNNEMSSTMEKFLMHQFQNDNDIDNSNGVVKKFDGPRVRHESELYNNPYLEGEQLPIAAKKGTFILV